MKAYMRNRKGVTIAETVIALVIIAAISAVTLSMIIMSIGVESKSIAAIETKNAAENAIECFRFARENEGENIPFFVGESSDTLSVSELFFACLQMTVVNDTVDGENGINYVAGNIHTDGIFEKTDEETEIDEASAFQLVLKDCTITITQKLSDDKVVGFTFESVRGEEVLESFTFPSAEAPTELPTEPEGSTDG